MKNEFLPLVESLRAEDASVEKLFGGESRSGRHSRRQANPDYQRYLKEAIDFYADVLEGRRPIYHLREALTTSDFPLLFGDIIDRQLLANYRATDPTYRSWARIATVADFRTVKRFAVNGSEAVLAVVNQQEEYPESKITDAVYTYAVQKYGRSIPFAFEDMINDDLDALKDIPARFARAALRTEEKFAVGLLCDANGPNATFFSDANKNKVDIANGASSNNPVLSIQALHDAFTVLSQQRDLDGEPITIDAVHLVVPPALQVTAENILNATELWLNAADGGNANQQVHTVNWMRNRVTLHVSAYIPIVASGANGMTSWFLIADPSPDQRPAFEVGFLRGHNEPEIWMKEPNAVRVGAGGVVNPTDGDFDTDSIRYRIRHILGGTQVDPKMAVASNGAGV
jgi:hypothetical protein